MAQAPTTWVPTGSPDIFAARRVRRAAAGRPSSGEPVDGPRTAAGAAA